MAFISELDIRGKYEGTSQNINSLRGGLECDIAKRTIDNNLSVESSQTILALDFHYNSIGQGYNYFSSDPAIVVSGGVVHVDSTISRTFLSSTQCTRRDPFKVQKCLFSGYFDLNAEQYIGLGGSTEDCMLSFGYNGSDFGVLYRTNSVDTFVAQSDWTGETIIFDPSLMNTYEISFLMAGSLIVDFSILSGGKYKRAHRIDTSNTTTSEPLSELTLTAYAVSEIPGIVHVQAFGIYSEGDSILTKGGFLPGYGAYAQRTVGSGVLNAKLFGFRVKPTFNGLVARGGVGVLNFAFGTDGANNMANFALRGAVDATADGVWIPIFGTPMEYNDTITTCVDFGLASSYHVPRNGIISVDLLGKSVFPVYGGGPTILIVTVDNLSNQAVSAAISWFIMYGV